jgi:multidrug efflux pump subunit AcrB
VTDKKADSGVAHTLNSGLAESTRSKAIVSVDDKHLIGRLAAKFYDDRRLTGLTLLLVLAAGLSSLMVLPRREDPMLLPRAAQVKTLFPGANADKVEALITEPIEMKLREVSEIKRLRSQSRAGASLITIELRDEISQPDRIWPEIRGKIEDSIVRLPDGASRPEFDVMEMSAYAWIAGITWDRADPASYGLMRRLALELRDQLLTVTGTKLVDLFGDPGEEVLVELDPAQIASTGISPAMVADRLRQADVKSSAGIIRSGSSETVVQFRNEFSSVEDIAQTVLETSQPGHTLTLRDIATLRRGIPEPATALAVIDSKPTVVLGLMLRDEQRIDQWAKMAAPVIETFSEQLPSGIKLDVIMEQERFVAARIQNLMSNLAMGMLAVSVTTFLLLGWRSALLVTGTLPVASMMVLAGMRVLDIPIHQMSITGLIIALGLLIDNAIIAADEVEISLRRGFSPIDAARDMVSRLFGPLLASTLTTVFAFAPIALMDGPSGEFVGSIAWTVLLAVFSSLFLSMTILPALAAWLQQRVAGKHSSAKSQPRFFRQMMHHGVAFPRLTSAYRRVLYYLFSHPWLGILSAMVLPILGFISASQLSEQFFPSADRSQFHIEVELEPSASMAKTQSLIKRLDRLLNDEPRVLQTAWFFGESAPSFYYNIISRIKNSPNFAQGIINLDSERDSAELIRRFQRQLDIAFPDARILVRQLEQGPPFDAPVEVRIFGPDIDRLKLLGEEIRLAASELPSVIHAKTILSEARPVAEVTVDARQAGWAGLTEQAIADQLFSRLEGLSAGLLIEQTEQIPVRVRLAGQRTFTLNTLRETGLLTSMPSEREGYKRSSELELPALSALVPISTVADIQLTPQRALIARYDGMRMNELKVYLEAESLPSKTVGLLKAAIDHRSITVPPGYFMDFGGEAQERNSAVQRLMANVSILVVGMMASIVLALTSFRLAGLIGMVAALSVGLGLGALWVFGYPFGFMAIIGTMGLIGIAINDSIVVVAALKHRASQSGGEISEMVDCVVEVTRHVLATTATTMAGFAPLMMDGGNFWPPLAVAIGGGVLGASLISLTLVPSAMKLIYFRPQPLDSRRPVTSA